MASDKAEHHGRPHHDGNKARSYGRWERGACGRATHAAHNAARAATRAEKAMRPSPLPAATTALMANMPAITSQKPAGAEGRWSTTAESVQAAACSPPERATASHRTNRDSQRDAGVAPVSVPPEPSLPPCGGQGLTVRCRGAEVGRHSCSKSPTPLTVTGVVAVETGPRESQSTSGR